jgi:hypothetical protein
MEASHEAGSLDAEISTALEAGIGTTKQPRAAYSGLGGRKHMPRGVQVDSGKVLRGASAGGFGPLP